MKYILLPLLVIVFSLVPIHAQKTAAATRAKIVAELMQIERDIGQANIRRDKPYFEMIEADEFIFTDSSGGITSKAEDIASLDKPAGDFKLVAYDLDEMKVNIYGDTAVVTGRTKTVFRGPAPGGTRRSRINRVVVKRKGKWQIVAGHSSRIPPQK